MSIREIMGSKLAGRKGVTLCHYIKLTGGIQIYYMSVGGPMRQSKRLAQPNVVKVSTSFLYVQFQKKCVNLHISYRFIYISKLGVLYKSIRKYEK
jgi:hypothetical protein